MGIDLSIIWFVIIVFATLMYIVMDGFDLGIGILVPAMQNADDRDVMVNSVAPVTTQRIPKRLMSAAANGPIRP